MSIWSHVKGIITVDVRGRTQHEKDYVISTVLDHLPRVTGSEYDMGVHYIKTEFHNEFIGCDEFGQNTYNLKDEYGLSDRCGGLDLQDTYYIIVEGNLRDRTYDRTMHEFSKWLCRLSKRLIVDEVYVKIRDDLNSYTYLDYDRWDNPYSDMYEWTSEDGYNWCDYLLWKSTDDGLPEQLKTKYIHNKSYHVREDM